MKNIISIFIVTLCLSLLTLSAQATTHSLAMSPSVKAAESYLRGLKTAKARFLQTMQDGSQMIGTFHLSRPGKLRFDYDDPIEDFVVADGFFIYFYDSEMGEQSNAPIGQTLADFILRNDLRLSGDVTVTKVQRAGGLLQITLTQSEDVGAGSLTLAFEENPMRLKKWHVIDAMGAVTEVELFNMETSVSLADELFYYIAPDKNDPYRVND